MDFNLTLEYGIYYLGVPKETYILISNIFLLWVIFSFVFVFGPKKQKQNKRHLLHKGKIKTLQNPFNFKYHLKLDWMIQILIHNY